MSAPYIFEVPPHTVDEDSRFPDLDTVQILEHLRYFLSSPTAYRLPAIRVRVIGGKLIVVRGHKYLRVASDLQHQNIRVVLDERSDEQLHAIARLPDVCAVSNETLEREHSTPEQSRHVLFFRRPLLTEEQEKFRRTISDALRDAGEEVSILFCKFPFGGLAADLELSPNESDRYVSAILNAFRSFSSDVSEVVSYQGRRVSNNWH